MHIGQLARPAFKLQLLAASAAIAWQPATAQDAPPAGVPVAAEDEETIVITGTSRARAAFDTPLAVSTLNDEALARLGSSSQADILNSIPTIKADAGGGEVASNVFIRGLPSGGQFQFTPLMYDGLPVFSSFGLNSSAYDVYYRNDLGIERLEFVRGGVSNLFGPGSVAGLINYISRTGGDRHTGTVQLEVAERDRYRGDIAISGPLGGNFYYALSGFYRSDEGPIRTGLDTEGFQVRGNLQYRFDDGSGFVALYGQYIDDKTQFYLPVPLDGTTRARAPGNDGRDVFSVQNNFSFADLGFNTPDGPFESDIADGVSTQGGSVALVFERDFGGGWGVNLRARYADYDHKFGLWSDGDGLINVPETLQSFLTNRGLGSLANARFTFADDGSAMPADYLLFANRFTDRDRPAEDVTVEVNVTKELTTGSLEHTFTIGGFWGNATARDVNVTTTYLAEFNNRPRLVDLVITNPNTGAQTVISQGGLLNAGAGYVNNRHSVSRYAAYVADQIEADRFAFDIGFRIERFEGDILRERTSTFVTDTTTPDLAAALRDVIWGNGTFQQARVATSEWAVAVGALYRLTDDLNIYANASRGYFFPEIRAVTFNALGQPASFSAEIIKQAEVGIRYSSGRFSASLAGLYTRLTNRRQVLFVNDGQGGFREQVNIVATEAYGLEATLRARLIGGLYFEGNLTLQDHKYTAFDTAPANIGNELERQPNFLYNAGLYYDDGQLDAAIFTNYTGDNFTAANNAIVLEGFNVVNLDAGYRFGLGGERSLRFGINVFNLFDTDATTEGSPRQDANQTTGGAFFVGRPVLPRRITGRLTFNF
ncbi:TonB-dependent receptor [Sphingosinicella sp. LHD-64]|uniref:TonB-dependent receptor n=1 Tax=Sphingosinicella sp. LHD-64 TaxID=3072139 RepID=UPI00280E9377|nr:TonB-dependent receptor [Sphingosinicella sp. LHD-64]MDQ8757114.1 TonB-dependent receptor [Sphingosinicella sp. LHD-64]